MKGGGKDQRSMGKSTGKGSEASESALCLKPECGGAGVRGRGNKRWQVGLERKLEDSTRGPRLGVSSHSRISESFTGLSGG